MNKLKLNVDALRIERFDVEPDLAADEGTVMGNQVTLQTCGPDTCYPQASCPTGSPCRRCVGF
ncbi:MAG TPA: hypothetical protein VFJ16_09795 [Longimicrobium sp.]|nr:hypothetical protein [Longimicrobium sp.]